MRVAFCLYGPDGLGGPSSWARRMLPRLARRGIDVVAVSFHTREGRCRVVEDLQAAGVSTHVVTASGVPIEDLHRLQIAFARVRPKVIVADHVREALMAGCWPARFGIPSVLVHRSEDDYYRRLLQLFVEGPECLRVAAVVAVSEELMRATACVAPSTIEVLRCPSGTIVQAEAASWRADPFHLVYVGRFEQEQKRIRDLVRTLISVSRTLPNVSATLYGDGPLRPEMEELLLREVGHRVSYGGRLTPDAVFSKLLEAQALVLLSQYEGLASAVQEALACGLPVIARRTSSGMEGVLIDNETALIVDDDEEVIDAVERLIRDKSLWQRLSAAGRAIAVRDLDSEIAADRWQDLLTRLGTGRVWPEDAVARYEDAEAAYAASLRHTLHLAYYEADWIVEHTHLPIAGLEPFFANTDQAWWARCRVLHKARSNGTLAAGRAAVLARMLANEGDAVGEHSDVHRYRTASLYQMGHELDRAERLFLTLAETATAQALRAGSRFHLALLGRDRDRVAEAIAHVRACLDIEPDHRAAQQLFDELTAPGEFSWRAI